MSDEPGQLGRVLPEALAAQVERRWDDSVGMGLVERLTGADYLSLVALFFAWSSAVLIVRGEVNWAILVMFGSFLFDKLDGYYARKHGISSSFGRQIDSFIDVFAYLVTGALLYHVALSPHPVMTVVVGFAILAFGGLRLVRHASEGFGESGGTSYYVGYTVVHLNFVVLLTYYADMFVAGWNGWLAAIPILLLCPLMVSGYKSYKTTVGHALAGLFCLAAAGLSLGLELAEAGVI
jgi:phosphatidylserine synthase